ncbi:hypothetical protein [Streptomyces lydicus]|uniref:hypothetical protein n=1 Tax=Streptomyces lydicus TaxID=47763 RepID=UPI0018FE7D7E|nr:hypothetical protein [Streptomyces lydicus]
MTAPHHPSAADANDANDVERHPLPALLRSARTALPLARRHGRGPGLSTARPRRARTARK